MKKLLLILLFPCLFSFTERNKQDQDNDRSLREQWVTATNGERFRDHPALELKGDILFYSYCSTISRPIRTCDKQTYPHTDRGLQRT